MLFVNTLNDTLVCVKLPFSHQSLIDHKLLRFGQRSRCCNNIFFSFNSVQEEAYSTAQDACIGLVKLENVFLPQCLLNSQNAWL